MPNEIVRHQPTEPENGGKANENETERAYKRALLDAVANGDLLNSNEQVGTLVEVIREFGEDDYTVDSLAEDLYQALLAVQAHNAELRPEDLIAAAIDDFIQSNGNLQTYIESGIDMLAEGHDKEITANQFEKPLSAVPILPHLYLLTNIDTTELDLNRDFRGNIYSLLTLDHIKNKKDSFSKLRIKRDQVSLPRLERVTAEWLDLSASLVNELLQQEGENLKAEGKFLIACIVEYQRITGHVVKLDGRICSPQS